MKEVLYYANEADNYYGTDFLKEMYEAVDYSTNPIKWKAYAEEGFVANPNARGD